MTIMLFAAAFVKNPKALITSYAISAPLGTFAIPAMLPRHDINLIDERISLR